MHVLAIVLGLLLLLFGGGCTLIFLVAAIMDFRSMIADIPLLLTLWVPLGVAPMVGGWFLFRHGLRKDRERRAAAGQAPGPDGGGA